jgi:hypothetical protein
MIEGQAPPEVLEGGAREATWPGRVVALVAILAVALVLGLALLVAGPEIDSSSSTEPTGTGFGARFGPSENER